MPLLIVSVLRCDIAVPAIRMNGPAALLEVEVVSSFACRTRRPSISPFRVGQILPKEGHAVASGLVQSCPTDLCPVVGLVIDHGRHVIVWTGPGRHRRQVVHRRGTGVRRVGVVAALVERRRTHSGASIAALKIGSSLIEIVCLRASLPIGVAEAGQRAVVVVQLRLPVDRRPVVEHIGAGRAVPLRRFVVFVR